MVKFRKFQIGIVFLMLFNIIMSEVDQPEINHFENITQTPEIQQMKIKSTEESTSEKMAKIEHDNSVPIPIEPKDISVNPKVVELTIPSQPKDADFLKINYASREKGADVLESSKEANGANALIIKDKDKYCINPCEKKLFVVIQLSEDITMEKFVVANYEQFSSTIKDFQVFGSLTYPTSSWKLLGNFTARSGQGDQQFSLRSTVRYLKFSFLNHHGLEYYCTLSQIRVHGTTVLAAAQDDLQHHALELEQFHALIGSNEEDDEEDTEEAEHQQEEDDKIVEEEVINETEQAEEHAELEEQEVVVEEEDDDYDDDKAITQNPEDGDEHLEQVRDKSEQDLESEESDPSDEFQSDEVVLVESEVVEASNEVGTNTADVAEVLNLSSVLEEVNPAEIKSDESQVQEDTSSIIDTAPETIITSPLHPANPTHGTQPTVESVEPEIIHHETAPSPTTATTTSIASEDEGKSKEAEVRQKDSFKVAGDIANKLEKIVGRFLGDAADEEQVQPTEVNSPQLNESSPPDTCNVTTSGDLNVSNSSSSSSSPFVVSSDVNQEKLRETVENEKEDIELVSLSSVTNEASVLPGNEKDDKNQSLQEHITSNHSDPTKMTNLISNVTSCHNNDTSSSQSSSSATTLTALNITSNSTRNKTLATSHLNQSKTNTKQNSNSSSKINFNNTTMEYNGNKNDKKFKDNCLESLNFSKFKEKVHAKVAAAKSLIGNNDPSSAKQQDRIFKTMMDMIKSLEIGSSIFELYVIKLHQCYSSILDDIKLQHLLLITTLNVSNLEMNETIQKMQSSLDEHTPAGQSYRRKIFDMEEKVKNSEKILSLMSIACFICTVSLIVSFCLCCVLWKQRQKLYQIDKLFKEMKQQNKDSQNLSLFPFPNMVSSSSSIPTQLNQKTQSCDEKSLGIQTEHFEFQTPPKQQRDNTPNFTTGKWATSLFSSSSVPRPEKAALESKKKGRAKSTGGVNLFGGAQT